MAWTKCKKRKHEWTKNRHFQFSTHVADEGGISVGWANVIVHVKLAVEFDVHFGVEVGVAPVAPAPALVESGWERKTRSGRRNRFVDQR